MKSIVTVEYNGRSYKSDAIEDGEWLIDSIKAVLTEGYNYISFYNGDVKYFFSANVLNNSVISVEEVEE